MLTMILSIIDVALPFTYYAESTIPADAAHLTYPATCTGFLLQLLYKFAHQAVSLLAGISWTQLVNVAGTLGHKVTANISDFCMDSLTLVQNVNYSRLVGLKLILFEVKTILSLFIIHLDHTFTLASFLMSLLYILILIHLQLRQVLS